MPPWFEKLMQGCEHLALDSAIDRGKLWDAIQAGLPRDAIEMVISDQLAWAAKMEEVDHEAVVARIKSEVIAALEES